MMDDHEKRPELTPEQSSAIDRLLQKMEESKNHDMRCLICNDNTRDRGLVFTQRPPAIPIIIGLCFPCKNLPDFEEEVQICIREYLTSIGREDLI